MSKSRACEMGNHSDCTASSCTCRHHGPTASGACSEGDHAACRMAHGTGPDECGCATCRAALETPAPDTVPAFERVYLVGTVDVGRPARADLFIRAQWDGARLSLTGVEGPWKNGNAAGGCGQIEMSYRTPDERAAIVPADGWTADEVGRLLDVWHRWHLNDMQAGSPAQMAALREVEGTPDGCPGCPVSHYDWARQYLAGRELHPDAGHEVDGAPYKYGSKWLHEDVPADVLRYLLELPASPRVPAWV